MPDESIDLVIEALSRVIGNSVSLAITLPRSMQHGRPWHIPAGGLHPLVSFFGTCGGVSNAIARSHRKTGVVAAGKSRNASADF
jgi:hypothetical protein